MNNFRKISFRELIDSISQNERVKTSIRKLVYLMPIIVYGLAFIFLLKVSQIVLDWRF